MSVEVLPRFRFACPGLRLVVVDPLHKRRKRHKNRLGAPPRLETKRRSTIVDEIELDVAPAPDELELTRVLCILRATTSLGNGRIDATKSVANAFHKLKDELDSSRFCLIAGPFAIQIVKENTSNPASFVTMFEEEVLVAPPLESRVI